MVGRQATLFEMANRRGGSNRTESAAATSNAQSNGAASECDVTDTELLAATGGARWAGEAEGSYEDFCAEAGASWIYPTNMAVRDYQLSIVKHALFANTLVSLPTGLGKTLIAAVVMFNFYRWYPRGKVIFLAPTKALVVQQLGACHEITGIPLADAAQMTGVIAPARRRDIWATKRVFFLTPQAVMNDLTRGVVNATDIKCLVVDEAHKALGDHAYCQVVRELLRHSQLFRVLALTATPGNELKSVQKVVDNLLIAHIELRTDECLEIAMHSFDRVVEKIIVKLSPEIESVRVKYLGAFNRVVQRLKFQGVLFCRDAAQLSRKQVLVTRERLRQNPPAQMARAQIGLAEADLAMCLSLCHGYELLVQHGLEAFRGYVEELVAGAKGCGPARKQVLRDGDFIECVDLVRRVMSANNLPLPDTASSDAPAPNHAPQQFFGHPKLVQLRDIVVEHFRNAPPNADTRAMIFAQYRTSVTTITDLLRHYEPLVRVMSFMGQQTSGKSTRGFTQKEQLAVVAEFRRGNYNVLVSTCIGEEGFDIGQVDLIVCFDAVGSATRLVQRMGRTGRKRAGRIVMLITEGREASVYNQGQANKRNINRALQNACKALALYPCNPRMVPAGVNPVCRMENIVVQLEVEESTTSLAAKKGARKAKVAAATTDSTDSDAEEIDPESPPPKKVAKARGRKKSSLAASAATKKAPPKKGRRKKGSSTESQQSSDESAGDRERSSRRLRSATRAGSAASARRSRPLVMLDDVGRLGKPSAPVFADVVSGDELFSAPPPAAAPADAAKRQFDFDLDASLEEDEVLFTQPCAPVRASSPHLGFDVEKPFLSADAAQVDTADDSHPPLSSQSQSSGLFSSPADLTKQKSENIDYEKMDEKNELIGLAIDEDAVQSQLSDLFSSETECTNQNTDLMDSNLANQSKTALAERKFSLEEPAGAESESKTAVVAAEIGSQSSASDFFALDLPGDVATDEIAVGDLKMEFIVDDESADERAGGSDSLDLSCLLGSSQSTMEPASGVADQPADAHLDAKPLSQPDHTEPPFSGPLTQCFRRSRARLSSDQIQPAPPTDNDDLFQLQVDWDNDSIDEPCRSEKVADAGFDIELSFGDDSAGDLADAEVRRDVKNEIADTEAPLGRIDAVTPLPFADGRLSKLSAKFFSTPLLPAYQSHLANANPIPTPQLAAHQSHANHSIPTNQFPGSDTCHTLSMLARDIDWSEADDWCNQNAQKSHTLKIDDDSPVVTGGCRKRPMRIEEEEEGAAVGRAAEKLPRLGGGRRRTKGRGGHGGFLLTQANVEESDDSTQSDNDDQLERVLVGEGILKRDRRQGARVSSDEEDDAQDVYEASFIDDATQDDSLHPALAMRHEHPQLAPQYCAGQFKMPSHYQMPSVATLHSAYAQPATGHQSDVSDPNCTDDRYQLDSFCVDNEDVDEEVFEEGLLTQAERILAQRKRRPSSKRKESDRPTGAGSTCAPAGSAKSKCAKRSGGKLRRICIDEDESFEEAVAALPPVRPGQAAFQENAGFKKPLGTGGVAAVTPLGATDAAKYDSASVADLGVASNRLATPVASDLATRTLSVADNFTALKSRPVDTLSLSDAQPLASRVADAAQSIPQLPTVTRPPDSMPIVFVSTREIAGSQIVVSYLRKEHRMHVQVCSNLSCDYVLSLRMGLVRFTLSDFTSPFQRKKIRDRLRPMSSLFERRAVIVEKDCEVPTTGPLSYWSSYTGRLIAKFVSPEYKLFFSDSKEDTAQIVASLVNLEINRGYAVFQPASQSAPSSSEFEKVVYLNAIMLGLAHSLLQSV